MVNSYQCSTDELHSIAEPSPNPDGSTSFSVFSHRFFGNLPKFGSNCEMDDYVFKDCDFQSEIDVRPLSRHKVTFVGCTFHKFVYVHYAKIVKFVDCTFRNSVQTSHTDETALEKCLILHKKFVTAYYCGKLSIANCVGRLVVESLEGSVSVEKSQVDVLSVNGAGSPNTIGISISDAVVDLVDIYHAKADISLDHARVDSVKFESSELVSIESFRSSIPGKFVALRSSFKPSSSCGYERVYRALRETPTFSTLSNGFPLNKFTMYKKAYCVPKLGCGIPKPVIVTLEVPENALRHVSMESGKVRVSEATVVDISPKPGVLSSVRSIHNLEFKYALGKTVRPETDFDTSDDECASGIHGFLHLQDAERY